MVFEPRSPAAPEEVYGLPLSCAQERLWFLTQLLPDRAAFNLPTAVRLTVAVDAPRLERALAAVVARHESLRTTFAVVDGRPLQVIHATPALAVPELDLSALPESAREAELFGLATAEARRPFDLARGPLLRAVLVRLAEASHVLLLTLHHLVADGWSLGILLRDLAVAYSGSGELPELSIQYADYAIWQRERLEDQSFADQWAFWRAQLEGIVPLELPTDFARPRSPTLAGARHYFELAGPLVEGLNALAQEEGATSFMVLLAAFETLLARYSGARDLTVGTPIANRQHLELENLVGLFVNTLVMRARIGEELTFRELVGEVHRTALAAYAHQDLPFERIVEALAPERSLARHPLFQVMFAFQNVPTLEAGSALSLHSLDIDSGTSHFDLALDLWPSGPGLKGRFEYSTELFRAETVRTMATHFRRLLEELVRDPDQPLSLIELAGPEEQARRQRQARGEEHPIPGYARVSDAIARQARRTPSKIAVQGAEGAVTFGELDARAAALAGRLARLGVSAGSLVAVHLESGLELIVALLAVAKTGAAYVPLAPEHPAARSRALLARLAPAWAARGSGAGLSVVSLSRWASRFRSAPFPLVLLDEPPGESPGAPPGEPPDEIECGSRPARQARETAELACVLATSGSTGEPKTVMIRSLAILNHWAWMQRRFGIGEDDAILQCTHPTFDVSIAEILGGLSMGARLVLPAPGAVRDPARLAETMARGGVTVLQTVPSMLRWLLDEPALQGSRLRAVFCGAETMPPELPAMFRARLPGARLFNLYGPTEATIDASFFDCAAHDGAPRVAIGRPIDNAQVYVLDAPGRWTPQGALGEIYVGGAGVSAGYLTGGDPGAFIADPFSSAPGARLFRTGDLGRLRPDGEIELWGRTDEQVKVRGFRVEPGEVEAALAGHPAVHEAAVAAVEDALGMRMLCAYVVPAGAPPPEELRAFLAERLPDYMIPSLYVALDRLPRTAGGKVDRLALPRAEPPSTWKRIPPSSATEVVVAGIWSELLGLERVGAEEDFFLLGGHSLLATRVLARVLQRLEVEIPLRTFFERPTVAALAAAIDRAPAEGPAAPGLALRSAEALLADVDRLSDEEVASILGNWVGDGGEAAAGVPRDPS